jgi:hypothetical protein
MLARVVGRAIELRMSVRDRMGVNEHFLGAGHCGRRGIKTGCLVTAVAVCFAKVAVVAVSMD